MRTGSRTVPRWGAWTARLALALGAATGMAASAGSAQAATPITHVVIIYQENHSFDNVLGYWCAVNKRCNGTRRGRLPNGSTVPLTQPPDIVPNVAHTNAAQRTAVDGGRMDGFAKISGCAKSTGYACYSEYRPGQIPNLIALAGHFAVSDRTFAMNPVPSFGAHVELVAQTLDGFTGDNPHVVSGNPIGPGWGCDSFMDAPWRATPDVRDRECPLLRAREGRLGAVPAIARAVGAHDHGQAGRQRAELAALRGHRRRCGAPPAARARHLVDLPAVCRLPIHGAVEPRRPTVAGADRRGGRHASERLHPPAVRPGGRHLPTQLRVDAAGRQLDRPGGVGDRERAGLAIDGDLHHLRRLRVLLRPRRAAGWAGDPRADGDRLARTRAPASPTRRPRPSPACWPTSSTRSASPRSPPRTPTPTTSETRLTTAKRRCRRSRSGATPVPRAELRRIAAHPADADDPT